MSVSSKVGGDLERDFGCSGERLSLPFTSLAGSSPPLLSPDLERGRLKGDLLRGDLLLPLGDLLRLLLPPSSLHLGALFAH